MSSKFKCCPRKDFVNFVCICCFDVYHAGCLQRKNEIVRLGQQRILCSVACQNKIKGHEQKIMSVGLQTNDLIDAIKGQETPIQRLKRDSEDKDFSTQLESQQQTISNLYNKIEECNTNCDSLLQKLNQSKDIIRELENIRNEYADSNKSMLEASKKIVGIEEEVKIICEKIYTPQQPASRQQYSTRSTQTDYVANKEVIPTLEKNSCRRRSMKLDSHVFSNYADNVALVKTITSKKHRCESSTTDACNIDGDGYHAKEDLDPEVAATGDSGSDGETGDNEVRSLGVDVDDYRSCGLPEEEPESKVIDIFYHPLKEEPEQERCDGDGDAGDVNGSCGDRPLNEDPLQKKPEPKIAATGDDAVADDGRHVGYDCSHCGISLSTPEFKVDHELRCKSRMQRRQFESQVTEVYPCEYCRRTFPNEEFKEQHQQKWCRKKPVAKRTDSNRPYFGCDKCKFVTKWKEALVRHVLNHNKNARWFACTQCSYKTVHKYTMNRHMKIHSNAFSCCCPICGKRFRNKHRLDDHLVRQHFEESDEVSKLVTSKVYTCNICDKFRTVMKTDFNQHLTITHLKGVGCQKYECPRCPYSTFRKESFKRHSKTHLEQKDYRCTVCKKQFAQKAQLDSHLLCNHSGNVALVKTITSKIHRGESSTTDACNIDGEGYHAKENLEREVAATGDGGGGGATGDNDVRSLGVDVDDYRGCGSPEEEPESKIIDIFYHPLKEEPEQERCDGDGDAGDVNGSCGDRPLNEDPLQKKPEPKIAATGDDAVADDGRHAAYDCSHCGISLSTPEFKVDHELRCKIRMQRREFESQVTEVYHCGYCRSTFPNKEDREQHQQKWCRKKPVRTRTDSNRPYFGCDKCKFVAKYKDALERHVLNHNKNNAKWFACPQCSYKTVHKRDMTQHMKSHSNISSCCCPICGKGFRNKHFLDDHLVRQHFDESDEVSKLVTSKVYTCNICDKFRTAMKANFNDHLTLTHLKGVGRQKYQCSRCLYSSFRKENFKRHLKTHLNQKDYRCTICKKQFRQKKDLDSHIWSNHADDIDLMKTITSKIHNCKLCSFKTIGITNIKRHVQSKHI